VLAVRRNLLFLRNLVRSDPAVWRLDFWDSIRLARAAKARGAVQKAREFVPLLALVRRSSPHTAVEIGTAAGGSFYAWCRVADPRATIVSIDLPGGAFGGGYTEEDIPRLRSYGRPGQRLSFLLADSHQESTRALLSETLAGAEIDFLMIDGDHTYEGVRRDFELYSPLLSASGLVAFHDILPHPEHSRCEVHLFWKEVKERYRHIELIDPHPDPVEGQWGGIGVLYWNE
jgi:predicted O-methyltransferase YrrM